MNRRVIVQSMHMGQQLLLRGRGRKLEFDGVQAQIAALFIFGTHVGAGRRIITYKDDREAWLATQRGQFRDFTTAFFDDFFSNGGSRDDLHLFWSCRRGGESTNDGKNNGAISQHHRSP